MVPGDMLPGGMEKNKKSGSEAANPPSEMAYRGHASEGAA